EADGDNDDHERQALTRAAESLGGGVDVASIYADIFSKPDLAALAASLAPADRQLAYEMAVGVCNADGAASQAEREFLSRLAAALGLPASATQPIAQQAASMASVPPSSSALDGALVAAVPASDADLDKMIQN